MQKLGTLALALLAAGSFGCGGGQQPPQGATGRNGALGRAWLAVHAEVRAVDSLAAAGNLAGARHHARILHDTAALLPGLSGAYVSTRQGPLTYALDRASLQAAQARSRESGRPVFLLFTGHACTNCQQMENSVLQQPAVVARLEKVDRVALFTDRESDPEEVKNRELLVSKFEHGVLPAFYLLDGEGRVLSAQIGGTFGVPPQLEPATQEFLRFLERGGLTAPAP